MATPDKINTREEHTPENQSPGQSGPGAQGYSGEFTIGDEGGAAGAEAFLDPTGTGAEMDPEIEAELAKRSAENDPTA